MRKQLASGKMAVSGDQWPLLVYEDQIYNPEEPWEGLFKSKYLVWVSHPLILYMLLILSGQAFKHIFTSPSSVEKEVKATRSGNARIHGMTRVTTASLTYVATQVHL